MRILVYGAGVLGCTLARNLFCAGKDVTLLARGRWADEIQRNGLLIKRKFHPGVSVSHIRVITELSREDSYDVIFVVVQYMQIDSVIDIIQENATKNIVFVGNNLRTEELATRFPGKNVMFAFLFAAGHRENNRVVALDLRKIAIGQLKDAPSNEQLIQEIFQTTKYKVDYQSNVGDFLLCHAAFVLPGVFACYKADGDLKKLHNDKEYFNKLIDANIEAYRAIERAGHEILPDADKKYESDSYRRSCMQFFKLMCATKLGKLCVSDHAMSAINEMSALNRDMKAFFDQYNAHYPAWQELERDARRYLK